MQRVLILAFLIISTQVSLCQKKYSKKDFAGTFMDLDYYTHLVNGDLNDSLHSTTPRLIFIDSLGNLTAEYRFEQKSKAALHLHSELDKLGSTILTYKYLSLKHIDDSLVEYRRANSGIKKTYKKISDNYLCIPCGIQMFFRNLFWHNKKKWNLTEYNDTAVLSTRLVKIDNVSFQDNSGKQLWRYEFADVYKEQHVNKPLYTIVFFEIDANFEMTNERVYGIIFENGKIFLYDKDTIKYVLNPI